jgi:hypothetical protein
MLKHTSTFFYEHAFERHIKTLNTFSFLDEHYPCRVALELGRNHEHHCVASNLTFVLKKIK